MNEIARETTKTVCAVLMFGLPCWLSWRFQNPNYLWLLVWSTLCFFGLLAHYENNKDNAERK